VPGRDSRLDLTSNERLIIQDLASGVPVSMLGGGGQWGPLHVQTEKVGGMAFQMPLSVLFL
jgi:hypothetical protein